MFRSFFWRHANATAVVAAAATAAADAAAAPAAEEKNEEDAPAADAKKEDLRGLLKAQQKGKLAEVRDPHPLPHMLSALLCTTAYLTALVHTPHPCTRFPSI